MASYVAGYEIINQRADVQQALARLREGGKGTPLAVDCEGDGLSRKGELSIVSVATETHTYLFDIKALGARVFDQGLRDLLQDPGREKLMFDCRSDSDCLWYQFKVKLANVLDLQLLQIIYRETHPEPVRAPARAPASQPEPRTAGRSQGAAARPIRNFQPSLRSFLTCLEFYVHDEELTRAKAGGAERMAKEGSKVWMIRPLDDTLLAYAAVDVQGFFSLYRVLQSAVARPDDMERLRIGSQNYLDYLRSRKSRTFDKYERNAFLPWRVLPDSGRPSRYSEDVTCIGCKRRFPRSDFIKHHLQKGIQKCPVCRKVYAQEDS